MVTFVVKYVTTLFIEYLNKRSK